MEVARGIEEMSTQESLLKRSRKISGDLANLDSAGIRRQNCVASTMDGYPLPEGPFDSKLFGDRFDDPLAYSNSREVIIEISAFD